MKAKLIVNNKEIEVEIKESELNKLTKTGYERAEWAHNDIYYYDYNGELGASRDHFSFIEDKLYNTANYYSNSTVAENNTRADKLMRQLRRFAVEHRKKEIDLSNFNKRAHYICYDHINGCLNIAGNNTYQTYGTIYFDSEENAQLAINAFHDELIWYFTEYKDSL